MRIRALTVEYNLTEAAQMLGISDAALKQAVDAGHLRCYYRLGKNEYQFHEASLQTNQELLAGKEFSQFYSAPVASAIKKRLPFT